MATIGNIVINIDGVELERRVRELVIPSCFTCAQWLPMSDHHLCGRFGLFMDWDDGCRKGWTARDGVTSGGTHVVTR
jgi:hypothetical protein